MRKATLAIGVSVVALLAWEVAASAALCFSYTTIRQFRLPYMQWVETAWWLAHAKPPYDPTTGWYLIFSAAVAGFPLAAIASTWGISARRKSNRRLAKAKGGGLKPTEPGVTDNHGHSQWRSMKEAQFLFPGPDPQHGGIVVGEAYRVDQDPGATMPFNPRDRSTWGKGGTAPLLIDPCNSGSSHSIIFAGSGSFKTVSAVSTILHWTGSSVILDPSTELGPMLHGALVDQEKSVFHIGVPIDEDDDLTTGFNALDWIDVTHPEAEIHVRTVVSWIYDEAHDTHKDTFFAPMGRNLVTCLLAHICWMDPQDGHRHLGMLAAMIAVPENDMMVLLSAIQRTSRSAMARQIAATLMHSHAEETFSGIFMNAVNGVSWLFTSAYADMVSSGRFNPQRLTDGMTTVFLNVSLRTLETTPAIGRVLVGALMNTVYQADGSSGRVLFLLDEAARLGKLKPLETARDAGRKYGITLHMLFQSIGQMVEAWGRDGTRAWIDDVSWIGYAAIRAGGAGKDLSDQLGSHGVLAYSEGDNSGSQKQWGLSLPSKSRGANTNVHEIRRQLMLASEMQQNLRADEIIIVPADGMPIRCGRAIYFRRPEMVERVAANRFAKQAA